LGLKWPEPKADHLTQSSPG